MATAQSLVNNAVKLHQFGVDWKKVESDMVSWVIPNWFPGKSESEIKKMARDAVKKAKTYFKE